MTLPLRCAFLTLLLFAAGCDNVGRIWDPDVEPNEPTPGTTESIVTVVPVGGDVRDGRPKVRATYPSGGGWPTSVPIVVEFNESVNEASILPTSLQANDARVIVRIQGSPQALPCEYAFLAQGRLLVLRPVTALSNEGTPTYEVVLLPEARDCDGVRFDVPEEGTVLGEFQVNQDESFVDGRILALWPRDNAKDLARENGFVVVFDRPATPPTVTAANLLVRPAGGTALAGTIDLPLETATVTDGRVVTFLPTAPLAASGEYELVVNDQILFGAEGKLDFNGRTPFARFETVAPAAPTLVELANPTAGFPDAINLTNVAAAQLRVTTPADAQAGDKLRVRVYGGDKATQGVGDLAFVERTAQVAQAGVQQVTVDFAGALGTAADPEFDDGEITFAAQLQRGSQTSGFIWQGSSSAPRFDVTPPTVQRVGPPGSADGRDLWSDTERVAFYGVASEGLASASLTVGAGATTILSMVSSNDAGRFVVEPTPVGRASTPQPYTLTVTDRAGNGIAAPVVGVVAQRGFVTGALAGSLTVEAYDQATLAPIAGATVLVDEGAPTLPAASTQQIGTTGSDGRASFVVSAPAHTVTIVRAGYDLVTMYTTPAAFVSLPLRPATNATATWNGTVAFTPGGGVTTIVGNTAVDSRSVLGVRTTNAAPNAIPDTPIVANRMQVITGFAGTFEPTANPPYTAHGSQQLGATLTQPTPPGAPAAGGSESRQNLVLLPSTGQLSQTPAFSRDFGQATGLDTGNLVGGIVRVRMTGSLHGFEGQALLGVGWGSLTAGANYNIESSYGLPLLAGLAPFVQLLWTVTEAQDTSGRISRSRALVVPGLPFPIASPGPFPIPTISAPGPVTSAPAVAFVDGLDATVPDNAATLDVTATDAALRRWVVLVPDRDAAGGTDTVQFPDLSFHNVQGLAAGSWSMVVEGRVWSTLQSGGADDCMLTERVRSEVEYARSAAVTFTVQ